MSRVLIFRFGQLGDTLVAMPALWTLRAHFDNAHLVLLSEQPDAAHVPPQSILPPQGLIDEYWTYPSVRGVRGRLGLVRLAARIRRERFDAFVYLAPGPRLRLDPRFLRRDLFFFTRVAGLRHVIGHTGLEPLPVRKGGEPMPTVTNETESLLARLRASGVPIPEPGQRRVDLGLTAAERHRANRYWEEATHGTVPRGSAVALGVGGKWPSKRWPEGHFADLGRRLVAEGNLHPVVFGGPEDRALGLRLVEHWGRGSVVAGELDVREAAALMEGMAMYVGNDSGTMHLAAAAGLRCVGIFSSQDWPGLWTPSGAQHVTLRHRVPCEGCRLRECNRQLECLTSITPDRVFLTCTTAR